MKTLPEIKDKEAAVNGPDWAGMSSRQQQEHMCVPPERLTTTLLHRHCQG